MNILRRKLKKRSYGSETIVFIFQNVKCPEVWLGSSYNKIITIIIIWGMGLLATCVRRAVSSTLHILKLTTSSRVLLRKLMKKFSEFFTA